MEEANFLTRYASKVYVVHRRNEFRASKIMIERAKANEKIEFLTPFAVEAIHAPNGQVDGAKLRNAETNETRDIVVDGVFVAIGHDPRSDLFTGQLAADADGYLLVDQPSTRTAIEGVFACGDVVDHTYRQAVTAAGTGCAAALDAERWLASKEH